MDEELIQIETELRRFSPANVPPALVRRIGEELQLPVSGRRPAPSRAWWWLAVPLAAAAATLLRWPGGASVGSGPESAATAGRGAQVGPEAASTEAEPPYKPVAAENLLVSARDEGLVTLADGTTARRRRLRFVDTITWRDPRTNASITWSLPREEVRVVPVVYQ